MNFYDYHSFKALKGPRITLLRLLERDLDEAVACLYSPTTWAFVRRGLNSPLKIRSYLSDFLESDTKGEGLTLLARVNSTGEAAGISRFHSAGPGFKKVEIGYTWISDRWMRTFVNTEKKFLMLQYAFDEMGVKRVEFAVDPRNDKSNAAMSRLGATLEGTLRKWRFLNELDPGDRNIYAVIDDEWPRLKERFPLR